MGSFATSLHVKSADADGVAAALADLLAEQGWRPTQKELEADAGRGEPGNLRGVQVSAAREGWVSVLDSDLMGGHVLTPLLAKRLSTHAIVFFVNDSDSWSYLLADAQGKTSEFDSEELMGEDDEGGEMVNAAAAISQLQSLMQDGSIMQKMQEVQERMSAGPLPEIRAVEERIKSGRGTAADMQQYQAWAMQEMPKQMADMRSMLGGLMGFGGASPAGAGKKKPKRKQSKSEQAAWKKRLEALCPLLAAGATEEQAQAVMERRAVFAEEVFGEFLPLLGIAEFYANLSYRYLDEMGPEELAAKTIRFVHHLRFETNRPRLFAGA